MNYEGDLRRPLVPPLSSRTLHHPSFLPLYLAAGFGRHHVDYSSQTVCPIIPPEFFYCDSTMSCGWRVPNVVTELGVFECFQLNTPPPVMSAWPAPPARPDPFRPGPHPTRDLGSLSYTVNSLHLPVQPSRVILQLTQEEDQAVTNLLKLHHDESLHPEPMSETDVHTQGRCWSHTELEAADTLLSCSRLIKDEICGQSLYKPETQTQYGEAGWGCFGFMEADGVLLPPGDFSEVWTLSESEGDAVHVLLSLCAAAPLDIRQESFQT